MANKTISNYTTQASFASGDQILMQRGSTYYKVLAENLVAHLDSDSLTQGATNRYATNANLNTWLGMRDTDDLAEGATNLYLTNERIDDRVSALIQNGTGVTWTYNDGANTLTPQVTLTPFNSDALAQGESNLYAETYSATITHAQILALNSNRIDLVTDVAGDKYFWPTGIIAKFNNVGTTAYNNNGINILDDTTGTTLFQFGSGLLNSSTDEVFAGTIPAANLDLALGATLSIQAATGNPTGGNASNSLLIVVIGHTFALG